MDLIVVFKNYLLAQKNQPSPLTVKNYLADIRKFVSWFETSMGRMFEAKSINSDIISRFKKFSQTQFSPVSTERYFSSLRKFFNFLKTEGMIDTDPFDTLDSSAVAKAMADKQFSDMWHVNEFENFLYKCRSSPLTMKNYFIDLKQFLGWLEKLEFENGKFDLINDKVLEDYKQALISDKVYSESSINRKLSSLRKYLTWAVDRGYFMKEKEENIMEQKPVCPFGSELRVEDRQARSLFPTAEEILSHSSCGYINEKYYDIQDSTETVYSPVPPVRLVQKILRGLDILNEIFLVTPIVTLLFALRVGLWKLQGKHFFTKKKLAFVENFRKIPYTPNIRKIPTSPRRNPPAGGVGGFSFLLNTLIYHFRYTRPDWYRKYHRYAIVHYINFGVLFVLSAIMGVAVYTSCIQQPSKKQAVEAASTVSQARILPFHARLTDGNNNPITSRADLRFGLYNNSSATGSALLWQEVDYNVKPDSDGNFSVTVGDSTALPQSIFTENLNLYLGVSIDTSPELLPRQELPTVSYATDAEALQGMKAITDSSVKNNQNTILALNSSGVLSINGTANTTFQSADGQLTLTAKNLTLSTVSGTDSNIQLAPDGQGLIDLQKPLTNTTLNNNIPSASGAVEVDKMFAVLATSSGQSAFTLEQDGAGPLLSASVSGVAKFTLDNNASIIDPTYAGANAVLYAMPSTGLFNTITTQKASQCLISSDGAGGIPYWGSCAASASASLSTIASNSANISFTNTYPRVDLLNNSALGFYNSIAGNLGEITAPALYINSTGNIGIGTISTGNQLQVAGTIGANAVDVSGKVHASGGFNGNCLSTAGYSNNGNCNQDVAEMYTTSEDVSSADVVTIDTASLSATLKKTSLPYDSNVIGVVTSKPGIILGMNGSDIQVGGDTTVYMQHADPRKPAVALSGKVPVNVSTENGTIEPGDSLTSSSLPGIAMKATKPGRIIGKALTRFSGQKGQIGQVIVFMNPGYNDPVVITNTGNIKTTQTDPYQELGIARPVSGDQNRESLKDYITEVVREVGLPAMPAWQAGLPAMLAQALQAGANNDKLISPLAEIDTIHTNVISPLSKDTIYIDGKIVITHTNGIASASASPRNDVLLEVQGTASVAGTLNSGNLAVNNDATISGTLYAHRIQADQIVGLEGKVATFAAQNITNVTNITYATPSGTLDNSASSSGLLATNYLLPATELASYSAYLSYVPHLDATTAQFDQGLIALGPASLSDTTITGQLTIASAAEQMILGDNSINVLGADLELQPLKQGGVSIASGMIRIDTAGDLTVNGKAVFSNSIATNVISPLGNGDVIIKNASGSGVLSINQLGDIIASGAANIAKLNLNMVAPAQAVSDTEIIATGSAGKALINPFQHEITIDTPLVSENSLIYITPVGTPSGQTSFLLRQVPGKSFTVGVDSPSDKNTQFNWLIIN